MCTVSMSLFIIAAATVCHARFDSMGSCCSMGATVSDVVLEALALYVSIGWAFFSALPLPALIVKLSVHCPSIVYRISRSLPWGYRTAVKLFFLPDTQPFTAVVYFGDVARGRGDVGAVIELNEGLAVDETFDVEGWEGDEVGFVVGGYGEEGVADLFDVDCSGKGGFLGVITL